MRCCHQRGFTLIQALGFLTILATVLTLATMLITQMVKFSGRENRRQQAEAKVVNAIEHFRRDVCGAERLAETAERRADRLVLHEKDAAIVYEWSAPKLTRTWQPQEGDAVRYEWQWEALTPEFAVEQIDGASPLVWLKFTSSQWDPDTRLSPPGLATAAQLGGETGSEGGRP